MQLLRNLLSHSQNVKLAVKKVYILKCEAFGLYLEFFFITSFLYYFIYACKMLMYYHPYTLLI